MEENHKKGKKKENHTTGKPLKQKGNSKKKKPTTKLIHVKHF